MWDYNKGGDNWSNKSPIILNSYKLYCMYIETKHGVTLRRLKTDLLIIM